MARSPVTAGALGVGGTIQQTRDASRFLSCRPRLAGHGLGVLVEPDHRAIASAEVLVVARLGQRGQFVLLDGG